MPGSSFGKTVGGVTPISELENNQPAGCVAEPGTKPAKS